MSDVKGYPPPGKGSFTAGRPSEGEDAGAKVAAWVQERRKAAGLTDDDDEGGDG